MQHQSKVLQETEESLYVTKGKRLDEAAEFISNPSGEFTVTCTRVLTNLHRGPTAPKPRALSSAQNTQYLPGLCFSVTAGISWADLRPDCSYYLLKLHIFGNLSLD